MTISSTQKVNVRTVSGSNVPWITGSAFLMSGELVLCDKNNSSIKHFDYEFKCLLDCQVRLEIVASLLITLPFALRKHAHAIYRDF